MKELALTLPQYGAITPPPNIPGGAGSASNILNFGIALLFTVILIASLAFILYGGVLWASSGGDKAKIDRARRTITFAIIGLIITILSFVIIRAIGAILGVPLLTKFGL